jgi:CelD/BcsL family acetyltransferase involved in cellulose biosynthesis
MQSFFSDIINTLSDLGILKFSVLELDNHPAAMVMCFEYNETIYLYNNGFDNRYRHLSVGSLCKALNIQESIRQGKRKYDFLKGAEIYKQRMGGTEVPLFRCQIRLQ